MPDVGINSCSIGLLGILSRTDLASEADKHLDISCGQSCLPPSLPHWMKCWVLLRWDSDTFYGISHWIPAQYAAFWELNIHCTPQSALLAVQIHYSLFEDMDLRQATDKKKVKILCWKSYGTKPALNWRVSVAIKFPEHMYADKSVRLHHRKSWFHV